MQVIKQEPWSFIQKPVFQLLIIGFLFISAFVIRLYHINRPPMDFHSPRQYHSALIARGHYFETLESIPEWRRQVAGINKQREGILGPPIMEHAAVFAYRIFGGEHLWFPRVLSSIFWLIGGAFLYLIAKKIASLEVALFSTVFYLFLPYGISASRSFQPDSLMVMMLMVSIFTILLYSERPSIFKLLVVATVSALAIFIKPYCLFLIFGAFISLTIYRQGVRKAVINLHFLIFAVVSLWPTIIYYGYGMLIPGRIQEHLQDSFRPYLLFHSFFWEGWLTMIGHVVGYIGFIAALLGILMFRQGLPRAMLIGLWIGYFIYGIFATYNIYTHDYYQLQFIPVVALSLGPIGAQVVQYLANQLRKRWLVAVLGVVFLAVVFGVGLNKSKVQWSDIFKDYKDQIKVLGAIIGVNPQFNEFLFRDFDREVQIAQEIGEIIGHSVSTVYLDPQTGRYLKFYGEFSGFQWPTSVIMHRNRHLWQMGEFNIKKCLNFKNGVTIFCPSYVGRYLKDIPTYFIVTDLQDFEEQADLRDFLFRNFPIIVQNDDYLIFDLRNIFDSDK